MSDLFYFAPQLAEPPRVKLTHQTFVERLRTGGERRSQMSSHYLREWTFDFLLEKDKAQKAREFFDNNEEQLIRFPDWLQPSQADFDGLLMKYENSDFSCVELFVTDLRDTFHEVVNREDDIAAQEFDVGVYVYPIRIGRIKEIPQFPEFGDDKVKFSCTFTEDISSRHFDFDSPLVENFVTFRGRPVFPFLSKDQSESWQNNVAYDRKSFGAETSYKREEFPKREISLSVTQKDRVEVRELIDFFDGRKGRSHGFWLSTGRANFQLTAEAQIGATTLELSSDFPETRDGVKFVELRTLGCESEYHEIIEINGSTITLAEPIQRARSIETAVSFLYCVRFSSDDLILDFSNDAICRSNLRFIELMAEYETTSTILSPRYVYEFTGFWSDNLTSYGREFTHGGVTYTPANITHDKISYKEQSIKSSCEVSFTPASETHPLYVFRGGFPLEQLRVKVSRIEGSTVRFLYEANARAAQYAQQREIKILLGSFADVVDGELPTAFFENRCSRQFLRTGCNLNREDFEVQGSLISSVDTLVEIQEAETEATARGFADWFLNGQVIIGTERRVVISQQGRRLLVSTPFINASPGDSVTLLPGCNRTTKQCIERYSNYENFGGMPFVPPSNPQLEAVRVNSKIPQGGKK